MAIFYVFQGSTYKEEFEGGYVWSPKLDIKGHRNAGYTMMTNIRKGDFIFHNKNSEIVAISVASTNCFDANIPTELASANKSTEWSEDGYRVDTKYYEFDTPVNMKQFQGWLKENHTNESAFTVVGKGKQQYMCKLADIHAEFLIKEIIKVQSNNETIEYLEEALLDIVGNTAYEYSFIEKELLEEKLLQIKEKEIPTWSSKKEKQETTTTPKLGRVIPKRNIQCSANALAKANYLCEYDSSDRTFTRKSGQQYTEPHHLIPISKYNDFEYSLDVMENIVSLCSHCHNLLHYGQFNEKISILEKLYEERKEALEKCGVIITLEQLNSYYK